MTTVANRFNSVATSTLLDTDCHRHLLSEMRYDHGINYCYQLIYIRCVRVVSVAVSASSERVRGKRNKRTFNH